MPVARIECVIARFPAPTGSAGRSRYCSTGSRRRWQTAGRYGRNVWCWLIVSLLLLIVVEFFRSVFLYLLNLISKHLLVFFRQECCHIPRSYIIPEDYSMSTYQEFQMVFPHQYILLYRQQTSHNRSYPHF